MEISINVEECEVDDFLDLLSGNLKKQKIIHIAKAIDSLDEISLGDLAYYLDKDVAKALLEAINTYHKDLHEDF